ncbi:TonB-dependent siderophore receptor [Shewanella avicenniae]|uniref:TonB-dependent siderophore receptor n=1 Tax=Shewanella avicenniae TaxID=2814294 RepID=A0ABX7QL97_9GAMM|nr:TonB-dependent siderophore receptor [Shewanella avicenniae]QSX32221.1 TonB-dependent siderophore receptor [Shewanella avicenniae]
MKYGYFSTALLLGCAQFTASAVHANPTSVNTATTPTPVTRSHDEVERITIQYRQAYRGDVPASALPQAITTLDHQLLQDIGAGSLQDAMDFSASAARQNNSGGMWDSFSLRGFPGNENMPAGYLINGFSGGRGYSGPRDPASIDYIEVLKGPGSALYGRSEPGGAVNIITKKPQNLTQGYLKTEWGSFALQRLEGDITGGITDDIAARFIGSFSDSDSYRDFVGKRSVTVTPSLRWQLTDDTSLLYEFEWIKRQQLFDRGIVVLNDDLNTVPSSRYLGEPGDGATDIYAAGHQITFEHFINDDWQLTGGFNHRHSTLRGYSSDTELSASRQSLYDDGHTLTRQRRYRDYASEDSSVRVELNGQLETSGLTHHLLLGADGYRYELQTGLYRYRGGKGSYDIDIFAPDYGSQALPDVSLLYDNREHQRAVGVYLQDQIDISEHWQALLGLRFDVTNQEIFEIASQSDSTRHDKRLSPRLGLVYQLDDELSFYGSYSEGFLPLSGTDAQGQPFGSEESRSFEVGAKWQTDSLQATLALFDAHKSNILVSDPVNVGFSAPLGSARSRGLELDASYQAPWFDLQLSYSLLNTETDSDSVNADWGVPIPKGSPLVNVPRHTLALLLSRDFYLDDIYLRAGFSYRLVDDRLGDAADLSFRLPAYQVYGAFLRWQLNEQLTLALNANNLFDKTYIDSSYNALWAYPGAPRNFKLSVSYGF